MGKRYIQIALSIIILGAGMLWYSMFLDNHFSIHSNNTPTRQDSHTINQSSIYKITDIHAYKKKVDIISSQGVDITPPSWLRPSNNTILSHWLSLLPNTGDRNQSAYIVIPRLGIIAPLTQFLSGSLDEKKALAGERDVFSSYFLSGVNIHPIGAKGLGLSGNIIIGGHSSYYKNVLSDYKTIFTVLPGLDEGDDIRGYTKHDNGWIMYTYKVTKSFYMKTFTPDLMASSMDKKMMTLYTCVPIGTAKDRWIIQAKYVNEMFLK